MMNESEGITFDKAYPISDEEGLSTTGYTFTIKNTCNTYATYEVNLEDMLVEEKRLSGEYIKVSINDRTPVNLKELEEKEAHIEESDKSYELTSGSLGPEEETTYTIKLWMDESTPAIEETMNATFLSKISIEAGYTPEENLENEITLEAKSITEGLNNKSEIFEITGTSTNYNLIEYSLDKSHWSRIESPSKNVTITQEFTEEGKYTISIRDEVGNIKEIEVQTTKLDKTVPEIKIEETDNQENVELHITFTDNEGLGEYAITESSEEPTEWTSIEGKETTIEYTLTENTTYYIWVKDSVVNISYQKYSTDTIDTQAPELTITNTLTDWRVKDTITIKATDDVVGISGISISKVEETYNWEFVENTLSYETEKEVTENGTYYISVRDAYGHITTKSIVIDKIDKESPTIQVEVKQDKYILDITVTAEDTGSGVKEYYYQVDENEWEKTTENTRQYTELSDGEHTIKVKVQDKVGNESEVFSKKVVIYHEYEASIFLANGTIEGGTTLTNLITNGSFEGDSFGWADEYGLNEVNNKILGVINNENSYYGNKALYIEDTSSTTSYWSFQKLLPAPEIGNQIYAAGYVSVSAPTAYSFLFAYDDENGDKVDIGQTGASNSEYTKISNLVETPSTALFFQIGTSTSGSNGWYKDLKVKADVSDVGSGISSAKYCTTTGSTCTPDTNATISSNSFTVTLNSNTSAQKVCSETIDNAGNTSGIKCSSAYQVDTTNPTQSFSIGSSTSGSNGWYKALGVKVALSDSHSGVASAKYCTTTGSTCTPGTNATISSNSFTVTLGSNASAQKVCAQTTDKSGRTSSVTCSSTYKVDTTNPTAKISASVSGNSIKVSASGSSDAHSGIANYQYSRDNKTWYTSTSNSYTFTGLNDGNYTVYVKVTDKSGRTSSTVSTTAVIAYTNVYISSSGNDSSGNGSSSKPYATIAKAYSQVKSGGNIILLSNITANSAATFGTANKNINLKSNGSSTYSITRGSSLKDSIIKLSNSNTLSLSQITINGNNVSASGPLIRMDKSTINLASSVTIQNGKNNDEQQGFGGGIYGGNSSTININGATIKNNSGLTRGAGITAYNTTINFNSGNITNNTLTSTATSNGWGGGVYVTNQSTFNMKGGTLSSNTSTYQGGGLWIGTSKLNIIGGTISSNKAGKQTSSVASFHGGGIRISSGVTGTISNCTISNNVAQGNGGGISTGSNLTIASSTKITGNTSYYDAGGVWYSSNTTLTYTSSSITGNTPNNVVKES